MKPRIHRLLGEDGHCLDVAVDHGLFGEPSFLPGIQRMGDAVRVLVGAGPDAMQLSVGQARILQEMAQRKPSLVLRVDVANVYGPRVPASTFSELIDEPVGHAVRLDAACLCVNLFYAPDQPELHRQCVRNITRLKTAADDAAMPMMVEPLALKPTDGPYAVNGDTRTIVSLVRQAVELGADVVKADPTDDLDSFGLVVEAAGDTPVLVRGGGRAADDAVLRRAETVVAQGAAGVVYGRNIIQHPAPAAMTRALMDVVHGRATAGEAAASLQGQSVHA